MGVVCGLAYELVEVAALSRYQLEAHRVRLNISATVREVIQRPRFGYSAEIRIELTICFAGENLRKWPLPLQEDLPHTSHSID